MTSSPAFHDVRFPTAVSLGASGGPERRTEIVALASGREERNTPWERSRRRYDAGYGVNTLDDLHAVIAFFEARRGRLHGFRWRDPADWSSAPPSAVVSATDQPLGVGDGVSSRFALIKRYVSGAQSYERPIDKPVDGSLRVSLDGAESPSGWSFDASTAEVVFDAPPSLGAAVAAGFEFDVPVRFDTDRLVVNLVAFHAGEIPSIPIVEIRP